MSLTSYRAAPPRVGVFRGLIRAVLDRFEDLAATYSPASWDAVPWALGVFTAEFGMGSGAGTPPWPPGRQAYPVTGDRWPVTSKIAGPAIGSPSGSGCCVLCERLRWLSRGHWPLATDHWNR
jgi:hypothetical protein